MKQQTDKELVASVAKGAGLAEPKRRSRADLEAELTALRRLIDAEKANAVEREALHRKELEAHAARRGQLELAVAQLSAQNNTFQSERDAARSLLETETRRAHRMEGWIGREREHAGGEKAEF